MAQRAQPLSPFPFIPPWNFPSHQAPWMRFPMPPQATPWPVPNFQGPVVQQPKKLVDTGVQTDLSGPCYAKPEVTTTDTQTFLADLIEGRKCLKPTSSVGLNSAQYFQKCTPEHRQYRVSHSRFAHISLSRIEKY